ncbi:MAG: class I SAM-dependent methyltransferase [Nitrososphaerales archaeon]
MIDSEVRNFEISSKKDELSESNRQIWKSLGISHTDNAIFFPAPNALVPLMFAKFMNKRKVTFVDTNEINVSTLIKLAAEMKLTNVTVKLGTVAGKFPIADSSFDLVYSDWGLSSFVPFGVKGVDAEAIVRELVRILKPGGKLAALEENGAPVMYPCPPEILSIRSKMDSHRAERLVMGRRVFGFFKGSKLRNIRLEGYSNFVSSDDKERIRDELGRRITAIESSADIYNSLGISLQELEKYKSWLRAQITSEPFLIQFNSILTVGEK